MNRKIISILLVLSMLVGILATMPISVGAADVITITSVDDWMNKLSGKTVSEKDIIVTASELDFSGKTVEPINGFSGTFNGNGVVIKNMNITTSGETGIFRCPAGDVKIENLVITMSTFTGKKWVGAVLCCTDKAVEAIVNNVYISDSVTIEGTEANVGGIIGGIASSTSNTYIRIVYLRVSLK